jgi:putative AlgH/UPF0301 family transcriptional regulator
MSRNAVLYVPNTTSYAERIRAEFRDARERTAEEMQAAFDALTTMEQMASAIDEALPKLSALSIPQSAKTNMMPTNGLDAIAKQVHHYSATVQSKPMLEPGTVLLSHPLATSHYDRRVVLLAESHGDVITGLVLDLTYTNSITAGNPMFPEVFWEHELCQGGPYHVDMTMPPTANVSILHYGVLNEDRAQQQAAPFSWLFRNQTNAKPGGETQSLARPPSSPARKRYQVQNVIIPESRAGMPPLYYSRVESLASLAKAVAGVDRKSVRIYWGSMHWTRAALKKEVSEGLWFPVTVSSNFFRSVQEQDPNGKTSNLAFPTEEELEARRKERMDAHGVDVQPPQPIFPPDQPMCWREPLWDQIMWTLGGEYRELAGYANPLPDAVTPPQERSPHHA